MDLENNWSKYVKIACVLIVLALAFFSVFKIGFGNDPIYRSWVDDVFRSFQSQEIATVESGQSIDDGNLYDFSTDSSYGVAVVEMLPGFEVRTVSQADARSIDTVDIVSNSEGLGVVQDGRVVLNLSHKLLVSGIEYDMGATKLSFPTITSDSTIVNRDYDRKFGFNLRGVPIIVRDNGDTILVFSGENVRIKEEEYTVKVFFGDNLNMDFFNEINQSGLKISKRSEDSLLIRGVQSYDPTIQFNGCINIGAGNSSTVYELTEDISCSGSAITFDGNNNILNLKGFSVIYANATSGTGITIASTSDHNKVFNGTVRTLQTNAPTGVAIQADGMNMTISNLTINILNTTAAARGITMTGAVSDYSIITGNTIVTKGTGNSEGLFVQGTSNLIVTYNAVNTSTKGITFQRAASNNLISYNKVNGTAGASNIELTTVSSLNPLYNNITYNMILSTGTATTGILLDTDVNFTLIEYNNVTAGGTSGFNAPLQIATRSSHNIVRNNNFSNLGGNNLRVVMVRANSTNNSIYNNKLHRLGTVSGALAIINDSTAEQLNYYNTSYQAGTNIVGGGFLGGNYYTNNTDTQFSGTCTDSNTDGICDTTFTFITGTDFLPLSNKFVAAVTEAFIGNATIVFPLNNQKFNLTNSTINYTQNGTTNMAYTWYIYYNSSFNHTATTNTTFNFSDGTYALNVSAYNGSVWSKNYSVTFIVENTSQVAFVSPANIGNVTIIIPTQNQALLVSNISVNYTSNKTGAWTETWYLYLNGSFNKTAPANTTLNLSDGSYALNVSVNNGTVWSRNTSVLFTINTSTTPPQNIGNVTIITPIENQIFTTNNISVNYTSNKTFTWTETWYLYLNGTFNKTAAANTTLNMSDGSYALNVSVNNGTHWSMNTSRLFVVSTTIVAPQMIGNASIVYPSAGQIFNETQIPLNYTQNGTSPFSYTWYIYLNDTFNKTAAANTSLQLGNGTYNVTVGTFNGSVWGGNHTIIFSIENISEAAPVVIPQPPQGGVGGGAPTPLLQFIFLNTKGTSYIHISNEAPSVNQSVTFSVYINSPQTDDKVTLYYNSNQTWQNQSLEFNSIQRVHQTTLPGYSNGEILKYYVTAKRNGQTIQTPPLYDTLEWGDDSVGYDFVSIWQRILNTLKPQPLAIQTPTTEPVKINLKPYIIGLGSLAAIAALMFIPPLRASFLSIGSVILNTALMILMFFFNFVFTQMTRNKQTILVTIIIIVTIIAATYYKMNGGFNI